MSRLVALVRLALGAVFLYAAATKLPDMGAFAESVANYRLVPPALVAAAAAAVIGVELAVGVLLVTGLRARAASLVGAALLAAFTVGLSQALLRGIDLRCGCFGGSEKATWMTVVRDVALLAAAALVAARGPGRLGRKASSMSHDHDHAHAGHDRHGNPHDFEGYLAKLDDPERAAWQRPDDVVRALGLRPGGVACDAGAGPGYFALRLAHAVAPGGRVHAIDVDRRMIAVLEERARAAGVGDVVVPLLAEDGEGLPPEPCDAVLMVNAFHHFRDGPGRLRRLAERLRPEGRLVNVDFHAGPLPVGPPPEHKVSREAFLAAAAAAGLSLVREETFLPYQYLVVLAR